MKGRFLHFVFAVLVLLGCGAAEDMLPKLLGVGFPVLLVAVQRSAVKQELFGLVLFALAAGAAEEALSSLPFFSGAGFFLLVALLIRFTAFPMLATLFTYPVFQLWTAVWSVDAGGFYLRVLVSLPVGLVTAFAVMPLLDLLERKAALDDKE